MNTTWTAENLGIVHEAFDRAHMSIDAARHTSDLRDMWTAFAWAIAGVTAIDPEAHTWPARTDAYDLAMHIAVVMMRPTTPAVVDALCDQADGLLTELDGLLAHVAHDRAVIADLERHLDDT